jgi:hypothetical protein
VTPPLPIPHLPLMRLRASRGDLLRALLEREPRWAHAAPIRSEIHGDRGVASYRLSPESFHLQVRWRWQGEAWDEREVDIVPGSVVALRLVLDDVPPAEVSERLALAPTRAFAKGEIGPLGRGLRDEGLWIHEVLPGGFCFAEDKLAELVSLLRGRAGLREVLGRRGVVWAGITVKLRGPRERPGGMALDARLLADLAGMALAFDLEVQGE